MAGLLGDFSKQNEDDYNDYNDPSFGFRCDKCKRPVVIVIPEYGDPETHPKRLTAKVDRINIVQNIKGVYYLKICSECQ